LQSHDTIVHLLHFIQRNACTYNFTQIKTMAFTRFGLYELYVPYCTLQT